VNDLTPKRDLTTTRRTVLIAGAGGAGLAVLAACASGGDSQASGDTGTKPLPAGGDPASGGSASTAQAAGSDALATLSDITVGKCIAVNLPGGQPAIVARPTADTARCFSAICTHQGCTVAPAGAQLNCPCHGSQYNALTGQVLQGPAPKPLPEIPVKVENGKVVTT
jgi:cytochrome b6-f complex iron-sulfur subunit